MLEIFYDGLSEMSKMSLDHSAGGSLHMKKTPEEAQELIDMIANNQYMVGQLSKRIPKTPSNTLPSNTEVNPKEECKALTMKAKAEPKEEQLARFLAILRKLQFNISFAEVLEKKLLYMACLDNATSEKTTLKGDELVVLTKEYSALVQKKLPLKMLDPGSFLTPCTKGTITFERALCDLGSSINLMPLSVMRKLRIQEVQHTRISLEMADRSLKRAYRMMENVLVKVEDLYLPTDFVILDTGEDKDNSIILGRPFLATARALIDVEKGERILRLWEDHILFKIPNPQSLPNKGGTTMKHLVFQPSLSVQSLTEPSDIKPMFGVGHPPSDTEEGGTKKKVPKDWRNKKITTEDFSPGIRVVFTLLFHIL
ncbi:uncharacterized protein LOC107611070 [Arachis ipaensis]|uniref:uncharacterized protein LOC107611070 n=1 Tax=Arachis ipaensis TaxID=130454 RepID=UPI0007AF97F0|nr:uncharacterized protein LOC107611070 [Arachis ipaensis]XP_025628556.1 uncharacterized protein LOC112721735 [Arachis hypogaea]